MKKRCFVIGPVCALLALACGGSSSRGLPHKAQVSPLPVSIATSSATRETAPSQAPQSIEGETEDEADAGLIHVADGLCYTQRRFVVTRKLRQFATGDFDGDQSQDLVYFLPRIHEPPAVRVLLGDGRGDMLEARESIVDLWPSGIAAGDLDGDGADDIVLIGPEEAAVYLADGQGRFRPHGRIDPGRIVYNGQIADVNGDSKADLIVPDRYVVNILEGKGDGDFARRRAFKSGISANTTEITDLDDDGRLDLLIACDDSREIVVLRGNGQGGFRARARIKTATAPLAAHAADLDRDGISEIVGAFKHGLRVYLQKASGRYREVAEIAVPDGLARTFLADFDRDGRPDVLTQESYGGTALTFLLGRDDYRFSEPLPVTFDCRIKTMALADFNGDDRPDLVVACGGAPDDENLRLLVSAPCHLP